MRRQISTFLTLVLPALALQLLSACKPPAEVPESTAAMPKKQQAAPATPSDTVVLSPEAAKTADIKVIAVEGKNHSSEIKTTGEIKADENRVFHINSIVAGRVVKDFVTLGQTIKAGQTLAIVQNLEVAKVNSLYIHDAHQNAVSIKEAKERLDLYKKNLERAKTMYEEKVGPLKDVYAAQNQVNLTEIEISGLEEHSVHIKSEAEAMLSAYGLKLDENADPHFIETGSPLRAPRSGVVIAKNITMGDVVTADQPLYVVADLSKVWLDVTVYDRDLDSISLGQKVVFRSDSHPKKVFEGTVSYIPPSASNIRTFTARAVLPNAGVLLKPGMFGQVTIQKPLSAEMPYLPDSAIQKYGNESFTFVALADNRFQKRNLQLGERVGDGFLIASGVKIGDKVAGEGSFKLKAEILKSQFGGEE